MNHKTRSSFTADKNDAVKNSIFQEIILDQCDDGVLNNEIIRVLPVYPHYRTTQNCHQVYNESFYIWTLSRVYECYASAENPKKLFLDLCSKGLEQSDAEPLGLTLGLDLHTLYEEAADNAYLAKEYDQAMKLYRLSNVGVSKLLRSFLNIGRMDLIEETLKKLLKSSKPKLKSAYLNLLLGCYLQRLEETSDLPHLIESLEARDKQLALICDGNKTFGAPNKPLFEEILNFIELNASNFEIHSVSNRLFAGGHTTFLLHLAHRRGEMKLCLDALVSNGFFNLSSDDVAYLCSRDYSNLLLTCDSGKQIFSMLAPFQQLEIILFDIIPLSDDDSDVKSSNMNTTTIELVNHAQLLLSILNKLDDSSLIRISQFLDPQKGRAIQLGLIYLHQSSFKQLNSKTCSSSNEFVLVYLQSLAILVNHKSTDQLLNVEFATALKLLYGQYNADRLLNLCFGYKDYEGAGIIYELESNFLGVFECFIRDYEIKFSNNLIEPTDEWYSMCINKFSTLWPLINSYADQAYCISILCQFWSRFNLILAPLEIHFLNTDIYVPLSFYLFNDASLTAPYVSEKAIKDMIANVKHLPFSSKLKLSICRKVVNRIQANQLYGKVEKERLWTEILHNIGRDLQKRSMLTIPSVSALFELDKSQKSSHSFVAFTCGHSYSVNKFDKLVINEFKKKMNSLPFPLPITCKFLVSDYSQSLISSSCPHCVYNNLLQEQISRLPDYQQQQDFSKWDNF